MFIFGRIAQAITVYRLTMSVCLSFCQHFGESFCYKQILSNEKVYKLETLIKGIVASSIDFYSSNCDNPALFSSFLFCIKFQVLVDFNNVTL